MSDSPHAFDGDLNLAFVPAILDQIAHPLFIKDRQFRWVLLNKAFCDMVSFPREQLLGKSDFDFFPHDQAAWFRARDEEVFASGNSVFVSEESITDSHGNVHILRTTKAPVRQGNEITHLVGMIHDVTDIKAAQDALAGENERLEQHVRERTRELERAQEHLLRIERLAVLGRLTGGLAHQIRNPLGSIVNAAYILKRSLAADPRNEVQNAIAVLLEETAAANRIITDLVDYARVRPPQTSAVMGVPLVERIVSAAQVPSEISVAIDCDAAFTKRPLHVDESQVRGALEAIVRNALDAMPDGGSLEIVCTAEGSKARISITDSGHGICQQVRARLFEPLITTKPTGMGLGLATARSLVENQGGTIHCAETSEAGTRFEIVLPLEPND
jgi:PAS domain S-box-containing protein